MRIEPDQEGNWINQGRGDFDSFLAMASKDGSEPSLFAIYSGGMKTNRDTWCYSSSRRHLSENISRSISFFNSLDTEYTPESDERHFKWCGKTLEDLRKGRKYAFDEKKIRLANYRPFNHQWLYMDSRLNWSKYLTDRYFPDQQTENRVICLSAPGFRGNFSVLMSNALPSMHFGDMAGAQCFPLHVFDPRSSDGDAERLDFGSMTDGITDAGLKHFQAAHPSLALTKDDVFHYVYGLLHSEEYRDRFADNLSKQLPRVPIVKDSAHFRAFVDAGRVLSQLHCDFEAAELFPLVFSRGDTSLVPAADPDRFFRVERMKFAGKRPNVDKSTIVYNGNITVTGIPLEAYDYVVSGKPAIEWVMERQCIKMDEGTGITNDANLYAIETIGDPAYPLKLLQRVITVSIETMKVVRSLPALGEL